MPSSKAARGIRDNLRTHQFRFNYGGMKQDVEENVLGNDKAQIYAVDIVNGHSPENGMWTFNRAGYNHLNATALEGGARCQGITNFESIDGTPHLIVSVNGKLKEIDRSTGTVTDIDASAGFSGQVDFQQYKGFLFSVDGNVAIPRKWNGTTASDSSGFPIAVGSNTYTRPTYAEVHNDRMAYANFQGGTNGPWPDTIVLSDLNSPEVFTTVITADSDAYVASVGAGERTPIVGIKSLFVPNSNVTQLVIFKSNSTYLLSGNTPWTDSTTGELFTLSRINGCYGALNNRCIIEMGPDLIVLNEQGIFSLSGLNNGTVTQSALNSDNVLKTIAQINTSQKDKAWAVHLKNRREIWFFFPTGSNTECNQAIVYRYPRTEEQTSLPRWSRRTSAGVFVATCGVDIDNQFYAGLASGNVAKMFTRNTYNGVGIPFSYEYPPIAYGNEKQTKWLNSGQIHLRVSSNASLSLKTKWVGGNNNNSFMQTFDAPFGNDLPVYGQARYGQAYYFGEKEISVPYKAPGNGKRLKKTLTGQTDEYGGPIFLGFSDVIGLGGLSQHWN